MTIAKDFASKLAVAFVAIAMIFMAIAPAVQAQETSEDLQKTINDLLAQVAALQGQLGDSAPTPSECGMFTMDLKTGSTGAQVMALQKFLNADEDTRVAAAGAVGSAGMETEYFGPATAAAVSKFQVKYRAEVLSPSGLVNPTGYWGPSSRAQANKMCEGTDPGTDDDDDSSDDSDDSELQGEGELSDVQMDDADDTDVQEGAEDTEIGVLTLEAEDGDIEVDRITFTLDATTEDAYDVFEEISLWVDGDKVADFDASDEDEYLDEDDGEFRFSGLGIVVREDEEVEVTIAATVAGSVDTLEEWTLKADEIRYFDADGVASDEDETGDLDVSGNEAAFEIVEEGEGEELKFSLGSNNPDATDIVVDEDDSTDGVTIMEYTIEAQEGDIELNTLFVNVTVEDTANATTTYAKVVDDIYLVIDGEEFKDEAVVTTGGSYTTSNVRVEFDIDGDIVIDEDEEVTVEVVVDFKAQELKATTGYSNGTTIQASVNSAERNLTDAEGADDIDEFSGTAVGDEHTIVATGIVLPVDGVSSETSKVDADGKVYQFDLEFEVSAVEGDFYIADNATSSGSATDGVVFSVSGGAVTSATGVLDSSADLANGAYVVREGETETFTLSVTVDAGANASYRVQLDEVWYSEDNDGENGEMYTPTPASDFRTKTQSIVA